jgi:hypothetical protein
MARGRDIKPGFFENEDLAKVSRDHRLLFVAMWTIADREGRLEDRPARIKIHSFPYDSDVTPERIDQMLTELQSCPGHPIIRYVVGGLRCIVIVNFKKHQHIHPNEKPSELPELPEIQVIPGNATESSGNSALPSVPSSLLCLPPVSVPPAPQAATKRKKSKPAEGSQAFEAFWQAYPSHRRNIGKPDAIRKWPGDEHATAIMAHLEASKASHDWQKDGGEYVLGMRRYLSDSAWSTPVDARSPQQQTVRWANLE